MYHSITLHYIKYGYWSKETAQQLGVLAVLANDCASAPNSHSGGLQSTAIPDPGDPMLSNGFTHTERHMHIHTNTNKISFKATELL